MKRLVLLSLALCTLNTPVFARNDQYMLKWADVVESQEGQARLDASVKVYFGEKSGPAATERRDGDEVIQIARGTSATRDMREIDIQGCHRAALAALVIYQQRAKQNGCTSVVGLISNYHGSRFSSPVEYECHAGGTGSHVQFKASYAK
jgi:hypothetical protein